MRQRIKERKGALDSERRSLFLETGVSAALWYVKGGKQGAVGSSERTCSQMALVGGPWLLRRKERWSSWDRTEPKQARLFCSQPIPQFVVLELC